VLAPVTVPMLFSPHCHTVSVAFAPATVGDSTTVTPPVNCSSIQGDGYLRNTVVTVTGTSANPDSVIAGWSVDGIDRPETSTTIDVTIGAGDPVVTARLVNCYTLDVKIDGAQNEKMKDIGRVNLDLPGNCIDGSPRYLEGTVVTATPEILVAGAMFAGWDEERTATSAPAGTGVVPRAARVFTMTANVATVAGFYLDSVCSRLRVSGQPNLVSLDTAGCGPGYYFDLTKLAALREGGKRTDYWRTKDRTLLSAAVNPAVPLDVYVSVTGDVRGCFGMRDASSGPAETNDAQKSFGPLRGTKTCYLSGDIRIDIQSCQSVVSSPLILVAGEASGQLHGDYALPSPMFVPDANGVIGAYEMAKFDWVQGAEVTNDGKGGVAYATPAAGACSDAANAFQANTDLALIATAPANAYTFMGFRDSDDDSLAAVNPYVTVTSSSERTLVAQPVYVVVCHTVTFTTGIEVKGAAPYCPGTSPEQNSFIKGLAIEVRATANVDGRWVQKFTSGVASGSIYEEPGTSNLIGYVFVDGDKTVSAYYPSATERIGVGIAQVFKIGAGILAVAAPIVFGIVFPVAGIFFGVLAAGAGISSLLGSDKAASFFDLLNPTKIATCAARWSFGNAGDPTGGANLGKIVSTGNKIRQISDGADVTRVSISNVTAFTSSAGFVTGLYSAGITHAEIGPQTVDELADTETMTGCLEDQWRLANADL